MARRRARELAFRTLFQSERGAAPLLEVWASVRSEALGSQEGEPEDDVYGERLDETALAFSEELLQSYGHNRTAVDAELVRRVEGWSFGQMSQTDLNVLRLAVTEMTYLSSPPEVVIEMAVRLAKKFGGDESGRFVNGVLAKVMRALPVEAREAGVDAG